MMLVRVVFINDFDRVVGKFDGRLGRIRLQVDLI